MDNDLPSVVAELGRRLGQVEDQLAIFKLICTYGPAVDSGGGEAAAALWTDDGVYDSDTHVWRGHDEIAGLVEAGQHQTMLAEGCAHILGFPRVTLDGDRAVATCYSRVYRRSADGYYVWRLAANRWELTRTPDGWRAVTRINRLIDGSDAARRVLARGAAG
ncbi:MAG TPA: nuclear transport factor 2 family protein [Acidimicrobiales bacterium]|nr:nuclear transport factor 2 family protein [Acidimicrobiales bacterium]